MRLVPFTDEEDGAVMWRCTCGYESWFVMQAIAHLRTHIKEEPDASSKEGAGEEGRAEVRPRKIFIRKNPGKEGAGAGREEAVTDHPTAEHQEPTAGGAERVQEGRGVRERRRGGNDRSRLEGGPRLVRQGRKNRQVEEEVADEDATVPFLAAENNEAQRNFPQWVVDQIDWYRSALGLTDWRIEPRDTTNGEGDDGNAWISAYYPTAIVAIRDGKPSGATWNHDAPEETVIHELLHVVFNDVQQAHNDAVDALAASDRVKEYINRDFDRKIERAIEVTAWGIMAIAYADRNGPPPTVGQIMTPLLGESVTEAKRQT